MNSPTGGDPSQTLSPAAEAQVEEGGDQQRDGGGTALGRSPRDGSHPALSSLQQSLWQHSEDRDPPTRKDRDPPTRKYGGPPTREDGDPVTTEDRGPVTRCPLCRYPALMGPTWKQRVLSTLLGATVASGLTTLILILVEATSVLLPTDTKFGVVFDAGSTHTSLFVYRWPADKQNSTGVVSQALACQVKGPGISSYASDPAQAGESLQGCLEEALVIIPQAKHQETPAFLGATAGMRLLSQKNSSQATAIFAAVSQALGRSPLDFRGAELLTGQDEGAFGWITINYILGRLVQYSFSGEWIRPLEGTLVGALDMGGASTQITFVPRGPILDESSQATFRLYGSEHRVYTHSYLCFGHDQMLTRLLAQLVQASPGPVVCHPCYHRGYRAMLSLATLYESPCVHTLPPQHGAGNLTVEGTGSPTACVSAIQGLFNFSSCEGRGHCTFDGVYQPPVQGQFYARPPDSLCPGLLVLLLHLRFLEPHVQAAAGHCQHHCVGVLPEALEAGGGHAGSPAQPPGALGCSNHRHDPGHVLGWVQPPWDGRGASPGPSHAGPQVKASAPGQERWLRDYCASGLYILTLLLEGYGFSEETWPSIEFRKQVGGTSIGWTLGYMLNLTSMVPAAVPAQWRAQSYGVWAAGAGFMVLTLGATLGAAAVHLLRTHG
uniref:ectonucleoside triphosphate diphosphohydrolase 8 isoform X3 n=1 Tax=Nyctereutes procyonoides TaxID=34880 RepID=UPI0024441D8F|nr:ectonucleoside triphosphate diphosphohydrolase 8 isoform X3 [Nyctereutes procyonoides]